MRLQKYIANCGYTSRRKAEELISQGLVQVNGVTVTQLGTRVDPAKDTVSIDGTFLDQDSIQPIYMVMNKPRSVMTTLNDPEGRKTVMDLCMEVSERIYPVGRLDYLSEGLLLLTNDGDFANFVMHPRHNITKVYEVKVFGAINPFLLKKLRNGVEVDGVHVKPLSVRIIKQLPNKTWLEFRLGEGRNREIRRICEAAEISVDKLKRVAIEGLSVDGIAPGNYRFFTKKQIMEALGFDVDGNRLEKDVTYQSAKKSISLRRKGVQPYATVASAEGFKRLRSDSYYSTLKDVKLRKKLEQEKLEREKLMEKEKAHERRQKRKERKAAIKEEPAPHAIIL